LPSTNPSYGALTIYNAGSKDAYFLQGDVTAIATTGAVRLPAGATVTVWASGIYLAAITAGTDTTTLYLYQANGPVDLKIPALSTTTTQGPAGTSPWPVKIDQTTPGTTNGVVVNGPVYGASGGAYVAVGAFPITGAYGGMASGTIIGSIRWTDPNYHMVLRSFTMIPAVTTAFTVPQYIQIATYKLTNYTAEDTGGFDATPYFGTPKDSIYPALTGVSVRTASAGTTGLTPGTRTRSNFTLISAPLWTGYTNGATNVMTVNLQGPDGGPFILRANEGFEIVTQGAETDATGSFAGGAVFNFTKEPN
jgi:hypothetical protein